MWFFRGGTLDPPSRCTENREWRWRSAMMANGWRVPPWSSLRSGLLLPQTFFGTPKTEWWITVFPHWDLGKMYQFQTNPNSIKWILQLASQIWRLSQQVGSSGIRFVLCNTSGQDMPSRLKVLVEASWDGESCDSQYPKQWQRDANFLDLTCLSWNHPG